MSEDMDLSPEDLAAFRAWKESTKSAPPQPRGPAAKKGSGDKAPSVADQIIAMADSRYEFGTSDAGDLYAVPKDGPRIARLLRGGRISLRAELARTYYGLHGKAASSSALADAMLAIEGRAQAEDPVPLHLRVAPLGKRPEHGFLLDLGRADGLVVTVTPEKWSVGPAAPGQPLFRRSQLTQPLPIPKGGGSLKELRGLLNVTDQSWPLLVSWLVAGLVPGIPHPLLFLSGEQGTAKSTATKMLVQLLDPSAAPARSTPKDPDDWSTAAVGSWVVGLDNLSRIPEWLSDAMCRAATGDANVKRTLYSDSDVTVQEFRRVLIVNGIDVGTLRGDLADRMIPVHLHRITQRRTETALWEAYDEAQPRIVGALLDLLVRTLQELPAVREKADNGEIPLPRMADYGLIMAALDKVSGSMTSSILNDYLQQRTELAEEVVESNQVATTLLNLMKRQPPTGEGGAHEWEGTTAELLDTLTHEAGITNDKWPRTPGALSGRINRVASDLDKLGVDITRQKSGSKRSITIRYIPRPDPSVPQPAPEPVQEQLMQ
ncbi:ATP-binding protein [Streptomyces sp. NBC_01433]|uniref:ATP-binding protein n=1 Tax=Streptomyces sp. NBC_01433 TaxID=2903864 RepID=UPI002252BBD8|nr:ATP-binding protein [Streptomyces sp. NBC_01433]MCX4682632.1 ATP-binding protein [Streptomyces sp. NBC_01433]MCX4682672.1 ATP-binding protein [Streptomyces sp. NBC_01433]